MNIEPVTLEGGSIRLVPLLLSHHAALCEVGLEERLWQWTTIRVQTPDDMLRYIQNALQSQTDGTALPFVIIEKKSGQVIGTTRYHSIHPTHRRLEIGFTWVALLYQRTGVNTEAKYLMLKHAFEEMQAVRVEFKADASNLPSRQALLHIGAKEEGILRKYMLSDHKGARDIALYSILDIEWQEVKANMEKRLKRV